HHAAKTLVRAGRQDSIAVWPARIERNNVVVRKAAPLARRESEWAEYPAGNISQSGDGISHGHIRESDIAGVRHGAGDGQCLAGLNWAGRTGFAHGDAG